MKNRDFDFNGGFVAVAKIAKPRGVRGELSADILTDFPSRFEKLKKVFAVKDNFYSREMEIEEVWFHKNRVVLKFLNVDSIEDAEELRGFEICIPESEVMDLVEDQFFYWDLEGCAVKTVQGEKLGSVIEVMRTGGTDILVVEILGGSKKDYLIPFTRAICVEVDIKNKFIKVDPPKGLLEC